MASNRRWPEATTWLSLYSVATSCERHGHSFHLSLLLCGLALRFCSTLLYICSPWCSRAGRGELSTYISMCLLYQLNYAAYQASSLISSSLNDPRKDFPLDVNWALHKWRFLNQSRRLSAPACRGDLWVLTLLFGLLFYLLYTETLFMVIWSDSYCFPVLSTFKGRLTFIADTFVRSS